MNQNVEKAHVYILTANGSIRSKSLINDLKNLGFTYEIVIGYQVNVDFQKEALNLRVKSPPKITGKYLSDGEIAAMLTHRMAQEKAIREKNIVFLEDDVILGKNFSQKNIICLFDYVNKCKKPTIISLYADNWSVFLSNEKNKAPALGLLKAIYPPASAVGYIMSEAALAKATCSQINFELPADWPVWSRSIDFYYANNGLLYIDKNPKLSIIGDRKQSKFRLKQYISSALILKNFRQATYYQVIQPAIWKLAVWFGKPYRECEDSEVPNISRIFPQLG